ncbi:mitochondrial RNA editing ligase 1 [Reticulomyxa filosa]|uniref:Mitochondrial RNA editing ligase 1 n=1 Tax=Reticulomyxa filosa TaxID=46433 RepID=X6M9D6_RETFI|nr:mitochondrial RNA editing ligase 1 [Reticulomyxa filosa]|eukprot:ETO09630.1 mitochondrial RNA editing ligase 1 [Reticulomyxa filosa]
MGNKNDQKKTKNNESEYEDLFVCCDENDDIIPPFANWMSMHDSEDITPLPNIFLIRNELELKTIIESEGKQKQLMKDYSALPKDEEEAFQKLSQLWVRYDSVENESNLKHTQQLVKQGHTAKDIVWVATEKVHGANFAVMTDGTFLAAARSVFFTHTKYIYIYIVLKCIRVITINKTSRNSPLSKEKTFFRGWEKQMDLEKDRVLACFHHIKKNIDKDCIAIVIYGELFGGSFEQSLPSSDISDKKNIDQTSKVPDKLKETYQCIQLRVNYSPYHHFYPFDILVVSLRQWDPHSCIHRYYLEFAVSLNIFETIGKFVVFAKPLKQGTLEELLTTIDINNFKTTIPSELNLPIQSIHSQSHGEGVVLRRLHGPHILVKYKSQIFADTVAKTPLSKRIKHKVLAVLNGADPDLDDNDYNATGHANNDASVNPNQDEKDNTKENVNDKVNDNGADEEKQLSIESNNDTTQNALQQKLSQNFNDILQKHRTSAPKFISFIQGCVNRNRIDSAISKIGPLTEASSFSVKGMVCLDIQQDLKKMYPWLNDINTKQKKILNKFVATLAGTYLSTLVNHSATQG